MVELVLAWVHTLLFFIYYSYLGCPTTHRNGEGYKVGPNNVSNVVVELVLAWVCTLLKSKVCDEYPDRIIIHILCCTRS